MPHPEWHNWHKRCHKPKTANVEFEQLPQSHTAPATPTGYPKEESACLGIPHFPPDWCREVFPFFLPPQIRFINIYYHAFQANWLVFAHTWTSTLILLASWTTNKCTWENKVVTSADLGPFFIQGIFNTFLFYSKLCSKGWRRLCIFSISLKQKSLDSNQENKLQDVRSELELYTKCVLFQAKQYKITHSLSIDVLLNNTVHMDSEVHRQFPSCPEGQRSRLAFPWQLRTTLNKYILIFQMFQAF